MSPCSVVSGHVQFVSSCVHVQINSPISSRYKSHVSMIVTGVNDTDAGMLPGGLANVLVGNPNIGDKRAVCKL